MSSARELVLERDLVAPLLSPWLVPRDVMSLSETSKACLREVRAGLPELNLNEKFGITDEHVITIVRCFPSLRSLGLNCDEDITDAAVSAIARLPMLRELDIGGCDVTDAGLSVLSEKLESLCLGDFSYVRAPKQDRLLSDATLIAAVRRCPCLLSLDLTCVKVVTDASIAVVAEACPLLKSIDLTMTDKFTDAAIVSLAKCRRLETVNLDWCNDITTIVPIAENCPLKKLVLDCKRLKEASIFTLAEKCPHTLKELTLVLSKKNEETYTSDSIRALARCRSLEKLNLSSCCNVTDASAVAVVSSCVGLRVLDLLSCRVTDESVMAIAESCPLIHEISLGEMSKEKRHRCKISDASIIELASQCTRLLDVTLGSNHITEVSFKALARHASCLRTLNVRCPITDTGLIAIGQQCPQLHTLDLDSPFVTDDGIAALSGMVELNIHGNSYVTAFAIAQLVIRSPDLEWFDTYDCRLWYPGEGRHELVRLLHEHLPNPEQSHPRIMEMLPGLTPRGQQ